MFLHKLILPTGEKKKNRKKKPKPLPALWMFCKRRFGAFEAEMAAKVAAGSKSNVAYETVIKGRRTFALNESWGYVH